MNQRIIGIDEKESAEELAQEVVANMQSGERVADISLAVVLYKKFDNIGALFTKPMFFATVVYERAEGYADGCVKPCGGIVE